MCASVNRFAFLISCMANICCDTDVFLLVQMTRDVPTVEGLATGSQTAPSWRPCSKSKLAALARRTIWLTRLLTGSHAHFKHGPIQSHHFSALIDIDVFFTSHD